MTLNTSEPICREYDFDRSDSIGDFTATATAGHAADFTAGGEKGVKLSVTDAADHSYLSFGDNLAFNIDRLMSIEYLLRIENWDDDTQGFFGVASALNVDPDVIAEGAWFKLSGPSNSGRSLSVECDDGTNDLAETPGAGIILADDSWIRLLIDFRTGIQSISPPGTSKPGKSSLQFTASNADGQQIHLNKSLTKHMDMSNYAGGLQPFFGLRQVTNAAPAAVDLYVKKIKVVAELPR